MQLLCAAAATIAARMLLLLWRRRLLLLLLLMMHEAAAGLGLCMRTLLHWWRHGQCHCRGCLATLILAVRYGDHIAHHPSGGGRVMYGDCGLLHMRLMMRMQGRLAAASPTAAAAAVVVAASGNSRAASSTAVVDHNVMTR